MKPRRKFDVETDKWSGLLGNNVEAYPHQVRGHAEVLAAIARGVRRILVVGGCGAGKTYMMAMLAKHFVEYQKKVAIYTNKKILIGQTSKGFLDLGVEHGVRAAGFLEEHEHAVQICSIQTEESRSNKRKIQELHAADLVVIDEAHVFKGPTAKAIVKKHMEDGAVIVGFTATPIDLEEWYDELIIAGQPSELRACGAIVPAHHFGPDEPDIKALKKARKLAAEGEDFSESQVRSAIMTPTIFARVGEWFEKLNPGHVPTLLFAPGVDESLWFAERFVGKGVPAAHIDGDRIWANGEWLPMKTDNQKQDSRDRLRKMSRSGEVVVVCNRFVLREGIDWGWLRHVIVATMFGSLQTFIQSLSRGGRSDRDPVTTAKWGPKEFFKIQDHGGNWARHGSINADREWNLEWTAGMVYGLRAERLRTKKEREPRVCPKCAQIIIGARCVCGFEFGERKSRPVVAMDGSLREITGDLYPPRRICKQKSMEKVWEEMYWRSKNWKKGRTFRAAMALFAHENNYVYPDPTWKFMPIEEMDWFRFVKDVPRERLR